MEMPLDIFNDERFKLVAVDKLQHAIASVGFNQAAHVRLMNEALVYRSQWLGADRARTAADYLEHRQQTLKSLVIDPPEMKVSASSTLDEIDESYIRQMKLISVGLKLGIFKRPDYEAMSHGVETNKYSDAAYDSTANAYVPRRPADKAPAALQAEGPPVK